MIYVLYVHPESDSLFVSRGEKSGDGCLEEVKRWEEIPSDEMVRKELRRVKWCDAKLVARCLADLDKLRKENL